MIEKERKFLLKELPVGLQPSQIKQAYLMLEDNKNLRVRIIDGVVAYLTYKTMHTEIVRTEYEYQIPIDDALEMYNQSSIRLEKTRYKTIYLGNHIDIDVYPSGKQVVEIEFGKELKHIPDYCGEEVTGNREYSNIWMALNP